LLGLIKRHEVQVLRRAGHSQTEVSRLTGVSLSEIRRIEAEEPVENYDDAAERRRRGIGRPSKAEPLRAFVVEQLARDPKVASLDLLQGAKLAGYAGSKSAFYALVARLRPEVTHAIGSVGELPGDESKHGFGDVEVRFGERGLQRIHFFVSQLSYSRWSEVTLVPDRGMESLLRSLVEHFALIGGVPLVGVFDRHNAAAIVANVDDASGPWHPAFAQTILDLGIGVDLRGRGRNERSGGPVERLVRWVKTSFFGARRFATASELEARLREWRHQVNTRATARGTGAIPQARMAEERVRLRPLAVRVDDFAPRIPVLVGPGPEVVYEGVAYPMPAETVGKRAMLYLHSGRVRIVGAGFDIEHERQRPPRGSEFSE
jgi:transposase